jgi:acyl-CoA thioester hydrolase
MISASVSLKAQFYDLDPMQVVWHGNYPRFLEQARCALLDKIGFNYIEMAQTRYVWPIVDLRIKYVRPIRFAQTIEVTATLSEYENRIKIDYLITDGATGEALTKARTIQVAVDTTTNEISFESPAELQDKVRRLL